MSEGSTERIWPPVARRDLLVVSGTIAALFLLLCVLHLHGFSLPLWHEAIDGTPMDEVLLGSPRRIRSDDWVVQIPSILSQTSQRPSFPVVNAVIGSGKVSNLVGPSVPMKHWLSAFRPHLWGYFAGKDFGLAWNWWFRAIGLLYAFWVVFCIVTRGRTWVSLGCALALLYSPFFQYWSMSCEPMAAMMALSFVSAAGIALSASAASIALFGILLAWAGGCFALSTVYPPYQVTLAYLFLALATGLFLREKARIAAGGHRWLRLGVVGAAGLITAGFVALYLVEAAEPLRALAGTVYPGNRISSGGDLSAIRFFNNYFTVSLGVERPIPVPLGNICERASCLFLFPPVLCVFAWDWIRRGRRPGPFAFAAGVYIALFLLYAFVGVPEIVARLTGLSRVEGHRAIIGAVIADFLLVAALLARPAANDTERDRAAPLVIAALWGAALAVFGIAALRGLQGPSIASMVLTGVAFAALASPVLLRWRHAAVALAVVYLGGTIWFNPLVRGGSEYLESNPLSKAVLELDRASGGRTSWVVYNNVSLPNLFRAIGVRAINGVQYYPEYDFWGRLDPARVYSWAYNRYAHVGYKLPETNASLVIAVPQVDIIAVYLDPDDPALTRLDVDYLLYAGSTGKALDASPRLRKVLSLRSGLHIYRVL